MSLRDAVSGAIGEVVRNASNFPEKVQGRLMGQDMTALREKLVDGVLAALSTPPDDDVREALFRELWGAFNPGFATPGLDHPDRAYYFAMTDELIANPHIEVRLRGTVTDAEVKAALDAYLDGAESVDWQPGAMRAALEAAMVVRAADAGQSQ